jgi:hypothetical protein
LLRSFFGSRLLMRFLSDDFLVSSLTPVSCTAGNPHSGCGHVLPRSTISLRPRFP